VDTFSGGQLHVPVAGLGDRLPHQHLYSAPPQHPVGGLRQPRIQLGQHPRRGVQQHPPDLLPGQAWHLLGYPGSHQLTLRGDLGAGIARADHHECAPRPALLGIGRHRGQLQLTDDVVAQVAGLGYGAEPVRVVGDARDRQQLVYAARGQDQPVVTDLAGRALRTLPAHDLLPRIHVVHPAEHESRLAQPAGQRDKDVRRLDQPAAHLGHQRQVQEVVSRVDDHDLGRRTDQL
jgi:hypothetical protein